jgi:hypothetical protein
MVLPGRKLPWIFISGVVLAVGAALAVALLPWERFGAPILAMLFFGGLLFLLALLDSPSEERRFVVRLLLVALAVRLATAALFYLATGGNESYIYSDAHTYDRVAWVLAQAWRTPGAVVGTGDAAFVQNDIYPTLLAGLYFLIGRSLAAAVIINILFGTAAVYLLYRLGAMLFGPVTARWAGWLMAFYTGFWLWEIMTLKDSLFLFLILLFFLGLYRLWNILTLPDRTPKTFLLAGIWAGALAAVVAVAGQLREYIPVILLGSLLLLPLTVFLRSGRWWRWALILGASAAVLGYIWSPLMARELPSITVGPQSTLFQMTEVPHTERVGIFLNWIIQNPVAFVRFIGLAFFSTLLAPYAWLLPGTLPEIPRLENYMIAYPGMWMWYLLIPFSFFGVIQAVRRTKGEAWPLIFYAAAVFMAVAIFVPREYRHRDMVMPIALLLAAEGLVFSRRWWALGAAAWVPLVGFIAWKLHSVVPILLAVALAAVGIGLWRIRALRGRQAALVRVR